jgi:flagellar hook-basal body complex protein FliE
VSDYRIEPVEVARSMAEPRRTGDGAPVRGFSETLEEALKEVNELQNRSTEEIDQVLQGDLKDVHSAMLALQKADLSFQLMIQVRNKLVEAYRDIMRMQ